VQPVSALRRLGSIPRTLLLVVLCVGTTGCQLTLDNPKPPDTAGLQASYNSPSGRLAAFDLERVTEAFTEQNALLSETDSLQVVGSLLDSVSTNESVIEDGEQVDPTRGARLLAVAKVTRICRGPEGDDIIDAERFGVVRMTAKGSPRGIFPIAWGRFENCSDHTADGRPFTIDGNYSLTLGETAAGKDVLFVFEGTIESARVDFEGTFDFRIRDDGTTELRVTGSDGDVVVAIGIRGQLIARDSEGIWTCDPIALSCENLSTGVTLQAETP
jgi:hypothetical protein